MRKHLLLLAALLMIGLGATAQKKKSQTSGNKQYQVYAVGFYNQENLFDTCHDSIRCMLWVSITRRTSSIPAMMPVRMITSISLLRDGMV